jgi:hypothetical protein
MRIDTEGIRTAPYAHAKRAFYKISSWAMVQGMKHVSVEFCLSL